jgi:hypothetical protein
MRFDFINSLRRRTLQLALFLCLLGVLGPLRVQASLEYEVKAAYLYRFITMTEWPAAAMPPEGQDITIGVYGANPFGDALMPLNGKPVKGRTLRVKEIASKEDLKKCQIVFVSASEREKFPELVRELQNLNILTVSEAPGFAKDGGIINFIAERNKVRFEINPEAARKAGLRVSSEVMRLARIVGG